jgi:hypothetical protein
MECSMMEVLNVPDSEVVKLENARGEGGGGARLVR